MFAFLRRLFEGNRRSASHPPNTANLKPTTLSDSDKGRYLDQPELDARETNQENRIVERPVDGNRPSTSHPPDTAKLKPATLSDSGMLRHLDQLERDALEAIQKDRAAEQLLTPRDRIKKRFHLPAELPADYKADESIPMLTFAGVNDGTVPMVVIANPAGTGVRFPQVLIEYLYRGRSPTADDRKVINNFLTKMGMEPEPI
jgi:hypothetical protein